MSRVPFGGTIFRAALWGKELRSGRAPCDAGRERRAFVVPPGQDPRRRLRSRSPLRQPRGRVPTRRRPARAHGGYFRLLLSSATPRGPLSSSSPRRGPTPPAPISPSPPPAHGAGFHLLLPAVGQRRPLPTESRRLCPPASAFDRKRTVLVGTRDLADRNRFRPGLPSTSLAKSSPARRGPHFRLEALAASQRRPQTVESARRLGTATIPSTSWSGDPAGGDFVSDLRRAGRRHGQGAQSRGHEPTPVANSRKRSPAARGGDLGAKHAAGRQSEYPRCNPGRLGAPGARRIAFRRSRITFRLTGRFHPASLSPTAIAPRRGMG